MKKVTRRKFMADSTRVAAGSMIAGRLAPALFAAENPAGASNFQSRWHETPDRVWIGPEFWANPLQDWRIADGRLECVHAAPDRHVHLLTRQLGEQRGDLQMRVTVGRAGGAAFSSGKGSAGFRIGIMGPLREYRNSLIFGRGLGAGLTADGKLFIGNPRTGKTIDLPADARSVELRLQLEPARDQYSLTISAHDPDNGKLLGQTSRSAVPADPCVGNISLVANFPAPPANGGRRRAAANAAAQHPGNGAFWFANWRVAGSKLVAHDDQVFGPILFSQYTLSGGILKLSAQMPPLGPGDSSTVQLQLKFDGAWKTVAEETIHPKRARPHFGSNNGTTAGKFPIACSMR